MIGPIVALFLFALPAVAEEARLVPVNIIDGTGDDRDSILALGPSLGLSDAEIVHIRKISGHVGCFEPTPVAGSGALFLASDQILTAGHLFFEDGKRKTRCYFRPQTPGSEWIALLPDPANARFGARSPKPGSNNDWAIVRLSTPLAAAPFPVDTTTPAVGDPLIVITAQPAGMEHLDPNVPVVQACRVRRAPVSTSSTTFYRSDCDATGASSGGMHLFRAGGKLHHRGITISTGPWRDPALHGAPYNEQAGSVTTALGTDAAILAAGQELAGD